MSSWNDIANRVAEDVPEPCLTPEGTWRLRVTTAKLIPPKGEGSGQALYGLKPVEPQEDVDPGASEAYFESEDDTPVWAKFWLGGGSRDEHKHLMFVRNKLGVNTTSRTAKEYVAASIGMEVIATVSHSVPQEEGDLPYVNVSKFVAV